MYAKRKIMMALMGLEIGGAETHVVELSKELARNGYEVIVVSNGGVYEKELTAAGIRCFRAPIHSRSLLCMIRSLKILHSIIKREKPDVVHAHARIPAFLCGILHTFMRFPFVTSAHWVFRTNSALKILTNWGQRTVAVSEDIKTYLIDNYGVDPKHIFVTINGIDTEKFSPSTSAEKIRAEFALDPNKPTISYVSRLDESRALIARQLIEITPRLKDKIPDLQILIAGGGDVFEELNARAAEVNRTLGCDCIKMAGARTDINEIVAVGDLFIGVSRAALEAMAAAKPVIVAGNEGYIGLFAHDKLALSQESNFCCRGCPVPDEKSLERDILHALCEMSRDERDALGAYGRSVIFDYYSVYRMASDCIAAYRQVWHPLRVLVSGYYGFNNLGDEAILLSIKNCILNAEPDCRITVLSNDPTQTENHYQVQAVPRFRIWQVLRAIHQSDLLLSGGGSLLQDHTSTRSLIYYLTVIRTAKFLGKPVFLYANGIGPVTKPQNRKRMKKVLDHVDFITLREEDSKSELLSMGVTNPNLQVTADPVYCLTPREHDKQVLEQHGIPTDKPLLGISIRDANGMSDNIPAFASFFDRICSEYHLTPVFLAMQFPNDCAISKKLMSAMGTTSYLFEASYEPETMLQVIGCMQAVLSTRLHTLIFAAKQRVPLMGFVYDPKVASCLDTLGMPSGGRPEAFDAEAAFRAFKEQLRPEIDTHVALEKNVLILEEKAKKNETYLLDFIQTYWAK